MTEKISALQDKINQEISTCSFGNRPPSLYEPLQYIMALGGKRIRPVLALLSYSLFGKDPDEIITPAVAIEVFHNFTLMHDDIMDKAPIRRGQPTVHMKWDDNTAILSGDVMLVKAYEMLMQAKPEFVVPLLHAFNRCATEVCEGQQLDMDFEKREDVSEKEYLEMIRLKTAVLLGYSMEMGGILAGQNEETCQLLRSFGEDIGIGFQLMDDILDVYGDASKFGKQEGGDIIANKKTFLLIEALEKSSTDQRAVLNHWIGAENFDPAEKVRGVKEIYSQIGIHDIAKQRMNQYFDTGLKTLDKLDLDIESKEQLKNLVLSMINRER